jgi:hypothetical protein
MEKCPCISKEEMKGEAVPVSSGMMAPMGVQFSRRRVGVEVGMPKSNDMLFASWGWRVVRVALSLKAP